MIKPNIENETAQLHKVIIGLGENFGGAPKLSDVYDPKSKESILNNSFPSQENVIIQIDNLKKAIQKYGVEVFQLDKCNGINQIFARDIGFVIDDKFIISNVIEERKEELKALRTIISQIPQAHIVEAPDHIHFEGGDILPWNDMLFIGYSKQVDFETYKVSRTNKAGVEYLKNYFSKKNIIAVELEKSDDDPLQNALHLDCIFQPIGHNKAIVFKEGFKFESDFKKIEHYFGAENLLHITRHEMYQLNSNIFSISPNIIISEKSFTRINSVLKTHGFTVEEVEYNEISKMGGLFRCSTLPLVRG